MASTYTPIATTTLGSAASSVTFSSISGSYTDLVLVFSGTLSSADYVCMRVGNGSIDTNSNYSHTDLSGNGTSASSSRSPNATYFFTSPMNTNRNNMIINFQNYSNTTTNKTALLRWNVPLTDGGATGTVGAEVALWRSTSAINQIQVLTYAAQNFAIGSTFTLYGIASEDLIAKATGGVITSDESYFYHTFRSTGTFTPKQSITADVLVVAGGGGGGRDWGAGGGAGGLLGFTGQALTATGYSVTVGAGGAGYTGGGIGPGSNGADSQFGALTLVKGGGAGGGNQSSGATGGSGGGVGSNGGSRSGGAATSGQGYRGGDTSTLGRTGGGGAGGPGGDNSSDYGNTSGGVGSTTYSSWGVATGIGQNVSGTYYLAGGGGTGASPNGGGLGGGGTQATGTANTGGGGAAEAYAGGSGVIIIRYPK